MSMVFLALGYCAFISITFTNTARRMLLLNVASCFLVAIYLFLNEAHIGGVIFTLAGISSIVQLKLYQVDDNNNIRYIAAFISATLALVLLYRVPTDILPWLAFSINRYTEAKGHEQTIRFGITMGCGLWAFYALSNGLYILAIVEIMCAIAATFTFVKSYLKQTANTQVIRV